MPTYTVLNKKTEMQFEVFCTWSEFQELLETDKNFVQVLSAPALVGDHVVKRMDGGMKDTFSRIAEAHPNSPLAERFGDGKTNSQKKVTEVAKKHGLLKSGGQNMSKLTNTYKTT